MKEPSLPILKDIIMGRFKERGDNYKRLVSCNEIHVNNLIIKRAWMISVLLISVIDRNSE